MASYLAKPPNLTFNKMVLDKRTMISLISSIQKVFHELNIIMIKSFEMEIIEASNLINDMVMTPEKCMLAIP